MPNFSTTEAACDTHFILARKPGTEHIFTHPSMASLVLGMPAAAAANSGEWFTENVSFMDATPQNQNLLVPGTTKRNKDVCATYWSTLLASEGGKEALDADIDVLVALMCQQKADAFLGITGLDALAKLRVQVLPTLLQRYPLLHDVVTQKKLRVLHAPHIENVIIRLNRTLPDDMLKVASMICEAGRLAGVPCDMQFLFTTLGVVGGPLLLACEPDSKAWQEQTRAVLQRFVTNGEKGGDKLKLLVAEGTTLMGKAAMRAAASALLQRKDGVGRFVDRSDPDHAMHAAARMRALLACKAHADYVKLIAVYVKAGEMLGAATLHKLADVGMRLAGEAAILEGALELLRVKGDGMFVPRTHPDHAVHARYRELARASCATQQERDVLLAKQVLAGNILGGQLGGQVGVASLNALADEGVLLAGDSAIVDGALELLRFEGEGMFVARTHPDHALHAAVRARKLAACATRAERCIMVAKCRLAGNILGGQLGVASLNALADEGVLQAGDSAILDGALELLRIEGEGMFVASTDPDHALHAAARARKLAACATRAERCIMAAKCRLAGNILGGQLGGAAALASLHALADEGIRLAGAPRIAELADAALQHTGSGRFVGRYHPDHAAHATERTRKLAACTTRDELCIMMAVHRRAGSMMGGHLGGTKTAVTNKTVVAYGGRLIEAAGGPDLDKRASVLLNLRQPGHYVPTGDPEHAAHAKERKKALERCASYKEYCMMYAAMWRAARISAGRARGAKRMPDALRGEPLLTAVHEITHNLDNYERLQNSTAPNNANLRALSELLCERFGPGGTHPEPGWQYTAEDCEAFGLLHAYVDKNLTKEQKRLPSTPATLKALVNDVSAELAEAAYAVKPYVSKQACQKVFAVIAERTAAAAAASPDDMEAQALAAAAQAQNERGPTAKEAKRCMQRQDYHTKRSTKALGTAKEPSTGTGKGKTRSERTRRHAWCMVHAPGEPEPACQQQRLSGDA